MAVGHLMPTALLLAAVFVACGEDGATHSADAAGGASTDAADATGTCEGYFGQPVAQTGLSAEQCTPTCSCGSKRFTFVQPSAARIAAWAALPPPAQSTPTGDPYDAAPPAASDEVCGVKLAADGSYTLVSAASRSGLEAQGAKLTHHGPCGLCSNLADLAVYARETDLTQPVRQCGIENLTDLEGNVACLEKLGFTPPCAWIWAYNTRHTRKHCFDVCMKALKAPYLEADGSLNACLQCDEDKSGPVFKAVAGRTRRNSGLASALCRPCSEVKPVDHRYGVLKE